MKKILVVGLLAFTAFFSHAQTMKELFVSMPDSLAPLFTKVNKADFADFLESHMKAQVKNKFDRISEMKVLTKDFLLLQVTPQSTFEMKLLPLNDSLKVICMVKTACAPACDSEIRFFDENWKELSASSFITMPLVDFFYQPVDSVDVGEFEELRARADILLIKASLSADRNELILSYTTPDYMDKESAEKLKSFLKVSPAVYTWKEGAFVLKAD